MEKKPIFAFDFSMIKPAMCTFINDHIEFTIFTAHIDGKSSSLLNDSNVRIIDRGLPSIKSLHLNESDLIIEHLHRASNLSDLIISKMMQDIEKYGGCVEDTIVSNEGFAFGAKGNAILELSGYKYIFMLKLSEAGFCDLRTFSPKTLKGTAGCDKKGLWGKDSMIEALKNEGHGKHLLIDILIDDDTLLKKQKNYVTGLDDIADSYWCMKKTLINEGYIQKNK